MDPNKTSRDANVRVALKDGEVAQAVDESSIDDEDDSLLALQKEQYFADRERFNALRQKLEQQQRDLYDNLLRSTGRKLKRGRLGATPSPFMAARSATRAVKVSSAGAGASKSDHKENDDAISNGRRGDSVQVSPIACNLDESLDKVSPANADVSADFQPGKEGRLTVPPSLLLSLLCVQRHDSMAVFNVSMTMHVLASCCWRDCSDPRNGTDASPT